MKSITINSWYEVPENYTGHVKYTSGRQEWYKDGELHREDGPAVIQADGIKGWWCLDDKYYTKEGYYKELHKRKIITEQELFIELL